MAESKSIQNMADEAASFCLHDMTRIVGDENKISGVKEELKKLMVEVNVVKDFLKKGAQMLRKELLEELDLERLLKMVAYDVEDAIEYSSTKMAAAMAGSKCFQGFVIERHARTLEKTIKSIRSGSLKPSIRKIQTYKVSGIQQIPSTKINQVPPEKLDEKLKKFVCLEDETETLIRSLMEETEEDNVIAITGMAGIGKTTLASKIYHDNRIRKEFPTCIWVDDFRIKELCLNILEQCMNPTHQEIDIAQESCSKDSSNQILSYFSHMNDDDLERAVTDNLKRRKYLLVMDDVRHVETLKTVKKILPKTGKVLITSRNNSITKKSHVLRFLNEEESWELLQLKVFGKLGVCPEMLKSIGQRIAQNCDGLPLAIVAAGNSLMAASSTKVDAVIASSKIADEFTRSRWKYVSENVKMFVADQDSLFERLESSYIELPQHMRECFLYLGVFPEDHEIPVRTLIRLWIAEGLIPDKRGTILGKSAGQNLDETDELAEETADQYLHHLVDRNLVMVGKRYTDRQIKTCRLHPLIYAFCEFKAATQDLYQEIRMIRDSTISLKTNCHRLCIYSHLSEFFSRTPEAQHDVRSILCFNEEEESSKIHECYKLCSLCFNQGEEDVSKICGRFKLLRVLHCSHAKFTRFPTRLGKLIHLRHISLSCDKIRVIPEAISSLRYLETLVVHTESASVHLKANIWSMFHLRHLVTKAAIVLAIRGKDEAAGKNLQTLTRLAPKYCTEDVFKRTPNLKMLGIRGNLADFAGADSLKKLEHLEKLTLINETAKEIQRNLDCLPLNIKRLTLSGTHLKWKSMSTLGKIGSLEILKLKNNAFMGGSWNCTKSDGFGRLGFLLIGTTDLDSWEASDDCFPSLKRLVLNNYEKLQKVPLALAKRVDIDVAEKVAESAGESAKKSSKK